MCSWSTNVTDRRTDGQTYGRHAISIRQYALCTKVHKVRGRGLIIIIIIRPIVNRRTAKLLTTRKRGMSSIMNRWRQTFDYFTWRLFCTQQLQVLSFKEQQNPIVTTATLRRNLLLHVVCLKLTVLYKRVSEWVEIYQPAQYTIRHSGHEAFKAITCTST